MDLESNWQYKETQHIDLAPNQTTEVLSMPIPEPPVNPQSAFSQDLQYWQPKRTRTYSVVVAARLIDASSGEVLSRSADWPLPYRYYSPPDPGLDIAVSGDSISVSVQRPIKGLIFSVKEEENVEWSDNGIDVMPGDSQQVKAVGLDGKKLFVAYLGCEKAREVSYRD